MGTDEMSNEVIRTPESRAAVWLKGRRGKEAHRNCGERLTSPDRLAIELTRRRGKNLERKMRREEKMNCTTIAQSDLTERTRRGQRCEERRREERGRKGVSRERRGSATCGAVSRRR